MCLAGAGLFVGIFLGSMVVGFLLGLLAALIFSTHYFHNEDRNSEAGLMVVFALSSYLLANAMTLSGIVSTLFCAMVWGS